MLSWSSHKTENTTIDLTAVADGTGSIDLPHAEPLTAFASACTDFDDDLLASARAALIAETSEVFMVDAAAVAANFEMMTRLADGTGARMPSDVLEHRAATIGAMGVAELTSRR